MSNSETVTNTQQLERQIESERKSTARKLGISLFFIVASLFFFSSLFIQEYSVIFIRTIITVMGFLMLYYGSVYVEKYFLSKLKHAELLAELMRLRTLRDKDL